MNKIFTFIIFLFISLAAVSQSFRAGVQFGIVASQVDGDNLTGYNKAGPFAGLFVNRPLGERSSFQLEMNYIQKGSRKNANPAKGIYDSYLMRLNYVEIPVLYKYEMKNHIGFHGGLAVAYLISHLEKDIYGPIDPASSTAPEFRDFDIDFIAGLSYNFKGPWVFVFRFSYSVIPIRDTPIQPFAYFNRPQHNNLLLTAIQYTF